MRTCEAATCRGLGVEPATVEFQSPLDPGEWRAVCAICEPVFRVLDRQAREQYGELGDDRAERVPSFRPLVEVGS